MIFDSSTAGPLLEQFKIAQEAEAAATTALHDALKSGVKDKVMLNILNDRMIEAHDKSMSIWNQLAKLRIDK